MRAALTIFWGLFCANSWTWCIGMFLPMLMIQRWGWWGFLAFAIPNVVGCTAFGYVVKNRSRSEGMVRTHVRAMTWFSGITVAYHMFFVTWLIVMLFPLQAEGTSLSIAAVVLGLALVFSVLANRDWLALAVIVYAVSLAAFAAVGTAPFKAVEWVGEQNFAGLTAILPFLMFGFLLCPYLDLTFHRALQHAPNRHAFGVFGVTFTVMIVLTVALWFPIGKWDQLVTAGFGLAVAHLLAQSVFTVGAHLREMRGSPVFRTKSQAWLAMIAPLAAAPLLHVARLFTDEPAVGEWLYLVFLSLYGTVLPAWFVWRAVRAGTAGYTSHL